MEMSGCAGDGFLGSQPEGIIGVFCDRCRTLFDLDESAQGVITVRVDPVRGDSAALVVDRAAHGAAHGAVRAVITVDVSLEKEKVSVLT